MARHVRVIGVPMDYGADRRGVDMGPSAIRYAGLAEQLRTTGASCSDAGDVPVPRAEERDPEAEPPTIGRAKFLREIREVCATVADDVSRIVAKGQFPLVLGGDHSIAIGSLAGSSRNSSIGVIWFDAHGDFNTPETTPSGNVHGMPLAAALGRGSFEGTEWATADGLREEHVAIVGLRDLDEGERTAIRDSNATAFTMSDIDEHGINEVVESALEIVTADTDALHVSLDMDWLDPNEAPGVGTPVRGGVTYREAHAALETIAGWDRRADGGLRSMDIVEVNPILDQHNTTAELATELAASGLGRRIL